MRRAPLGLALAAPFLVAPFVVVAQAQLPHAFYGTVRFSNGSLEADAPKGALVVAMVGGAERGRVTLPRTGVLGDPERRDQECQDFPCLVVQDDIASGVIQFLVNGIPAVQTAIFDPGEVTEIDLRIADSTPPFAPTGVSKTTPVTSRQGAFVWGPTFDAGSGVGSYLVQLDGGPFLDVGLATQWTAPSPLNDGPHTFRVRATDLVGNRSFPGEATFLVDATAPTPPAGLSKTTPDNQATATFTWTPATDVGGGVTRYVLRIDGGAPVSLETVTTFTTPAPPAEGRHTVTLLAEDAAGNQSPPTSHDFLIDLTPPPVPAGLSRESPGGVRPEFSWEAVEDNISGLGEYQTRLDEGEWLTVGLETFWSAAVALEEGQHTFEVRVLDRAGNVGEPAALGFIVDTTPPTAPGEFALQPPVNQNPPVFQWTPAEDLLSGVSEYQVRVDGAKWVSVGPALSWTVPAVLVDGSHAVSVRAVDGAGNTSPPATVEFVLDTLPPEITSIVLAASGGTAVLITWSTGEPSRAHVEYGETRSYGRSTAPQDELYPSHWVTIAGLSELRATPRFALLGQRVTISARVSSIGPQGATYSLPLLVNGQTVHTAEGTLGVGDSVELSFILLDTEGGGYAVEWGGLEASFEVEPPLLEARFSVELPISPETAVATDERGRELEVTEGNVHLKREAGEITLVLPVVSDPGAKVSVFLDRESGLSLTQDRLVMPIKDAQGQVVARIVAEVEAATGTGSATEVKLLRLTLEVPERSVDLSAEDEEVGRGSVELRAELRDMPEDMRLQVALTKLPPGEVTSAIEESADREGNALASVAFSVTIEKEGLEDIRDVGRSELTLKVGRLWAERHGVERVRVFRLSDAGELEALETSFAGFEGESAVFETVSPNGLSVFTLVALEPLPPRFEVLDLSIRPEATTTGQPVAIETMVFNTGGTTGLHVLPLLINGVEEERESVVVQAQGAEGVTFSFSPATEGRYTVQVGDLMAELRVSEPARFVITRMAVEPSSVLIDEEATVSVDVTNAGGAPGTHQVTMLIDGVEAAERDVTLAPGSSAQILFTTLSVKAGTFTVQVGEERRELRVLRPARFSFSGFTVAPSLVRVGDEVSASIVVTNIGDVAGSRDVDLLLRDGPYRPGRSPSRRASPRPCCSLCLRRGPGRSGFGWVY